MVEKANPDYFGADIGVERLLQSAGFVSAREVHL
jgi:hypothetical protein